VVFIVEDHNRFRLQIYNYFFYSKKKIARLQNGALLQSKPIKKSQYYFISLLCIEEKYFIACLEIFFCFFL